MRRSAAKPAVPKAAAAVEPQPAAPAPALANGSDTDDESSPKMTGTLLVKCQDSKGVVASIAQVGARWVLAALEAVRADFWRHYAAQRCLGVVLLCVAAGGPDCAGFPARVD